MKESLLDKIANLFKRSQLAHDTETEIILEEFLSALEAGIIRAAFLEGSRWKIDERVKEGILLAFRHGKEEVLKFGRFTFIDKHNLWPRSFDLDDEVRVLPNAFIRRGAYVGKNVVAMPPSFVNIGAFVDAGCLIDSHVLVGSCAQIGKRVHLSAAAQIGGVLEPVSARPVIVEDDCLIGGNCGLYEGVCIGEKAVIGAGVILTKTTKIFDLVNDQIIEADSEGCLTIPKNAVVVPGSRGVTSEFGKSFGISVACPLIVKYRDKQTEQKTKLEDLLR